MLMLLVAGGVCRMDKGAAIELLYLWRLQKVKRQTVDNGGSDPHKEAPQIALLREGNRCSSALIWLSALICV